MQGPSGGFADAIRERYELLRELGHGVMAVVYLCHDRKLGRDVALKLLRPGPVAALGADRFLREIEIAAGLTHPNILPVYDSGEADGQLFYTMPYLAGESLRDRLDREKQLPLEDALRITREIADALGYAHARGVIHRDIKPENILFQDGHALLADFGIARAVSAAGAERLTDTGYTLGTPAYMSPEQATGARAIDARTDVYSLAFVLYEMLSGETPFSAATPQAAIAKKLHAPTPRISVVRELVPRPIEAALLKALAKAPADRFPTAQQFAVALAIGPSADHGHGHRRPALRWASAGLGTAGLVAAAIWSVGRGPSPGSVEDPTAIPIDSASIAVLPFQVVGRDSTGTASDLAQSMGRLFELVVTGEFGYRIRYPGSVDTRWRQAGGRPDSTLSEEAELGVARAVGAGRLVRGTVAVLGDSLVLAATMLEVPGGSVRAAPVRVEGTLADRYRLVNQLIVRLLAKESWRGPERSLAEQRMARYRPDAVQAYMASWLPPTFEARNALRRRALELDSTLVDAALWILSAGEDPADSAVMRYAWEHRDLLTEFGRAYLPLLAAGRHGPVNTAADRIAGYSELARRWPEVSTAWLELGPHWAWYGPLTGEPEWDRQAEAALARNSRGLGQSLLIGLALMHEDTARARGLLDRFSSTRDRWAAEWPIAFQLEAAYAWYLAVLRGDSAAARRILDGDDSVSGQLTSLALMEGRGLALIDRVIERRSYPLPMWGWVRGRADLWQAGWGDPAGGLTPIARASTQVYWALLQGPAAEPTAAAALGQLEAMARGEGIPKPSPDEQAVAGCWVTLWRLEHGDTTGARGFRRFLETGVDHPFRFAGWARLFEALQTESAGGDPRAALLALDSVLREVPFTRSLDAVAPALGPHEVGMPFIEVHNLLAARMLARHGEPARALAAVRRRNHLNLALSLSLPEYLREEGRLAVTVGDTAGAIKAYRRYLALRENPDPPWRAQWDSVRVESSRLAGTSSGK